MAMTPEQAACWELRQQGLSIQHVADRLGIPYGAAKKRLARARRWADASEGQQAALEATGLDPDRAKFGWRIVQHDDGSRDSVFWDARGEAAEDTLEAIREAVAGIPATQRVKPPKNSNADLLTLIPVADLHTGMMAWGAETGEDYNTKKAVARLTSWVGQVVERSPKSQTGVILFNGDTLHANDMTNATPQSKHTLDVDTRQFRTLDLLIWSIGVATDSALLHFEKVHLVVKPGNHDRDAYLAILFALAERYRNEPRVEVDKCPSEFWAYKFGKVMLASHHGDKGKAERMVLYLADAFPDMWGATRHRFLWTGHLHHMKAQDIGGVQWEQSRAVTAKDAYAASHGYSARSELQAVTYHREKGEVSRVKVTA